MALFQFGKSDRSEQTEGSIRADRNIAAPASYMIKHPIILTCDVERGRDAKIEIVLTPSEAKRLAKQLREAMSPVRIQ